MGIVIRPRIYTPEDYGALGNGTADDTAAIQAAINACPSGGTVELGPRVYAITDAIVIAKSLTFKGAGVYNVGQSLNSGIVFDTPAVSPFLEGTVLLQKTGAKDGILISAVAKSVHLRDFGIRFADNIRHVNTGHGINATPGGSYLSGHDHGLMQSVWKNVSVFGVDGDHYGFYALNQLHNQWEFLRSYGGGGFFIDCDSYAGNYGNLVASHLFAALYQDGAAYGYRLRGRAAGSAGYLNLITLIRPQVNRLSLTSRFSETTAPSMSDADTQFSFHAQANVGNLSVIQPDFEPNDVGPVLFNDGTRFITPDGYYGSLDNGDFIVERGARGGRSKYINNSIQGVVATALVSAGAQAGSSPPSPVGSNNGDFGGSLTFGTGTGPSAGILARISFSQFRGTAYHVAITPLNAATQALGLYVTKDGSGFNIHSATVPAASQANTAFAVDYHVDFAG